MKIKTGKEVASQISWKIMEYLHGKKNFDMPLDQYEAIYKIVYLQLRLNRVDSKSIRKQNLALKKRIINHIKTIKIMALKFKELKNENRTV